MEKPKRSKKEKELAQKDLEDQALTYVINEEIMRAFNIKNETIKTLAKQGKIDLVSLFI